MEGYGRDLDERVRKGLRTVAAHLKQNLVTLFTCYNKAVWVKSIEWTGRDL